MNALSRPVRPLLEARTYRELVYLLLGAPLAVVWFALLLTGWLAVGLLSVTPLVVPALVGLRWASWFAAGTEGVLAQRLLGVGPRVLRPVESGRGYWGRIRAALSDQAFWAQQAYLVVRVVAGFAIAVGIVTAVAACVWLAVLPLTYHSVDGEVLGVHVQTLGTALAFSVLGLAGLVASAWLVRLLAAGSRRLLGLLEHPTSQTAVADALRRALPAHVAVYCGLNAVLIAIWATTSSATFWPKWTLLALALPLAVHAWAVFVDRRRVARTRGLALALGAAAALFLFVVGVWAVSGGGPFWPLWVALGLAITLAIDALATMGRRIDVLATTRAGAVDAAESDLRRIERDLHDGAQARLVAVGMSIGLAEQKLASDPDEARRLLAEARLGTGDALRELRDLARGIHPPILTDRGLEAALDSLVAHVPVRVDLDVQLAERPPEVVETAAYFVAAEALANASKHAHASRVEIRAAADADGLVVTVTDDGRGGADPNGAGLGGLRRRVEALDGTLRVSSPTGGPTTVEAVLPCGS